MGDKLNGTVYTRDLELMSAEHKLGVININGRMDITNNFANLTILPLRPPEGQLVFLVGLI